MRLRLQVAACKVVTLSMGDGRGGTAWPLRCGGTQDRSPSLHLDLNLRRQHRERGPNFDRRASGFRASSGAGGGGPNDDDGWSGGVRAWCGAVVRARSLHGAFLRRPARKLAMQFPKCGKRSRLRLSRRARVAQVRENSSLVLKSSALLAPVAAIAYILDGIALGSSDFSFLARAMVNTTACPNDCCRWAVFSRSAVCCRGWLVWRCLRRIGWWWTGCSRSGGRMGAGLRRRARGERTMGSGRCWRCSCCGRCSWGGAACR